MGKGGSQKSDVIDPKSQFLDFEVDKAMPTTTTSDLDPKITMYMNKKSLIKTGFIYYIQVYIGYNYN